MNINKAMLAPLIAAIALFVKQVFGYEIPEEWQDASINLVLFIIMGIGLFMHPKKPVKEVATTAPPEQYDIDNMV